MIVAAQLLPQTIAGIVCNAVAGCVLHRVNNTLILFIGAVSFMGSSVLLSLMREESSYWSFTFPGVILIAVGADLQFSVANVS